MGRVRTVQRAAAEERRSGPCWSWAVARSRPSWTGSRDLRRDEAQIELLGLDLLDQERHRLVPETDQILAGLAGIPGVPPELSDQELDAAHELLLSLALTLQPGPGALGRLFLAVGGPGKGPGRSLGLAELLEADPEPERRAGPELLALGVPGHGSVELGRALRVVLELLDDACLLETLAGVPGLLRLQGRKPDKSQACELDHVSPPGP